MADVTIEGEEAPPPKSGKKGLLVGLVLAVLAGAGSFYAVSSGLILGTDGGEETETAETDPNASLMPLVDFVPLEAITVSLAPGAGADHLRFRSQLEVTRGSVEDVTILLPRIVDVMNSYLRAVSPATLAEPDILPRLRSQLLRRIRLVVGEGRVNDLLIMEFILK